MSTTEAIQQTTLRNFLETVPPGITSAIVDLGLQKQYTAGGSVSAPLNRPDIELYCGTESCGGVRLYKSTADIVLRPQTTRLDFVSYVCKNCSTNKKTFALWLKVGEDPMTGSAFKYGEVPTFGPPTPARVISLVGPQKDLFLKGRRSENQGLGIAAFAYYRRVIEDEKNRIFDQIIKVCQRLSVDQPLIDELNAAKKETQFSKAVESIKHGIPQALLINGHNPLTLLHSALSEGLHAQTDEECLDLATSIRVVLADFVERVGQALKDEAELTTAISRLINKKTSQNVPTQKT